LTLVFLDSWLDYVYLYYMFLTISCHIFNFISEIVHEKVVRGGRRVEISIYDLVVGDVIPLNIGNQVHDIFIWCFAFYSWQSFCF
jgi:magnesium-transporting ATPase (P-type)